MESDHSSQWAGLAGLRFFLAVCVVVGHFSLFVRHDPTRLFGNGILNPGSAVFGFFILSGYSIAASVARESSGFYLRRVVRIWPLYLATISAGLAVQSVTPIGFVWPSGDVVPPGSTLSTVASLLMLQTILAGPMPSIGQIWSLAPEWWHYMVAPTLKRLPSWTLMALMGLSWLAFMLIRPPLKAGIDQLQDGLTLAVSSWLWVAGFLYFRLRSKRRAYLILLVPASFAAALNHFTGAPLFIAIFALLLSTELRLSTRGKALLNFLGDWSFPLYLFHLPALIASLTLLGPEHPWLALLSSFVSSLFALFAIDYPTRRRFDRLAKRRRALAQVAEQDRPGGAQPAP